MAADRTIDLKVMESVVLGIEAICVLSGGAHVAVSTCRAGRAPADTVTDYHLGAGRSNFLDNSDVWIELIDFAPFCIACILTFMTKHQWLREHVDITSTETTVGDLHLDFIRLNIRELRSLLNNLSRR